MPKGGGFKSYLNTFQSERDKATFKSYLDNGAFDDEEEEQTEEVVSHANAFFDANITPPLLKGEVEMARGKNVIKFVPFTDKTQGFNGTLFVTNFRISFISIDRSSYDHTDNIQKNQLISDDDIPLCSIEAAYQVSPSTTGLTATRRRKLAHGMTITSKTKYLELHCKNFRLHRFWLNATPLEEDRKILSTVTSFALLTRPPLLFGLAYGRKSNYTAEDGRNHLYSSPTDWEWELDRLGGIKGWEVTQVNEGFILSDSIPESFVKPARLPLPHLKNYCEQFVDNRPPTWSYTFVNGASLVRMAYLRPENQTPDIEARVQEAVRLSHHLGRVPTVIDLGKECPSLRDLQQSYEKLTELVRTDSEKDFWATDLTWLSSLESTHWLESVQTCLQLALRVTTEMEVAERTVILKESSGRDFCCVVSSLVQIMLDPQCRTLEGFQLLVQREWVAMAHPFQQRCGLITSSKTEQSPVFLVFLDCVWQMTQQFPSSFAFTETYLTTLWDSVFVGLFETFLFDSPHQQKKLCIGMTKTTLPPIRLPSVWKWNFQFKNDYQSFFHNPLYVNRSDLYSKLNSEDPSPKHRSVSKTQGAAAVNGKDNESDSVFDDYPRKLNRLYQDVPNLKYRHVVLKPDCSTPLIRLWNQCYIRWLAPSEIIGGGPPSRYLQQCLLTEEVIFLQHKLQSLDTKKRGRSARPRSDLIFSFDNVDAACLLQSSVMTSSFPFTPVSPSSKQHHTRVFTPLSSYLENSPLGSNDFGDDD